MGLHLLLVFLVITWIVLVARVIAAPCNWIDHKWVTYARLTPCKRTERCTRCGKERTVVEHGPARYATELEGIAEMICTRCGQTLTTVLDHGYSPTQMISAGMAQAEERREAVERAGRVRRTLALGAVVTLNVALVLCLELGGGPFAGRLWQGLRDWLANLF